MDGEDQENRLRDAAYRMLSRREHSEQELRRKLMRRSVDPQLVDHLLNQLIAEKLLSNTRFTEAFVHSRKQRGSGPVKLRFELAQRGIDQGMIAQYVPGDSSEWLDIARSVERRKFGERACRSYVEWVKRARYLQRKGFTSEQIVKVLGDWRLRD